MMYSDYEVERWYLGKPFEDDTAQKEGGVVELVAYSDEDVDRLFLGLPLMAA
jgi:hypothetical protein